MKIFLDTAGLDEIKKAARTGLIDGVTTNPTLIKRSGRTLPDVAKELTSCYPQFESCLLYTSPSPRDRQKSRMPSSA